MLNNYNPSFSGFSPDRWVEKTWRGYSYRVWRPYMPKMPSILSSCVFYIYPSEDDAKNSTEYGGTGFFFGVESEYTDWVHCYAVTNVHIVFRNGMENPVIRINTKDNKFDTIKTSRDEWIRHPAGDDVAICPFEFRSRNMDIGYLVKDGIADENFLKEFSVGVGDDIVMTGRFRVHAGKERNHPVLRFGNIAAMNDEPISNNFTQLQQESYLVEMRSISGFSGSPVFIFINPLSSPRQLDSSKNMISGTFPNFKIIYQIKLLGIQWGQISYMTTAKDTGDQSYKIGVDSAMEGVVPIQKLMDLIYSEEMIQMREKENKKRNNNLMGIDDEKSSFILTTNDNENIELTQEKVEDVLKKIAHPLKPNGQEKKGM